MQGTKAKIDGRDTETSLGTVSQPATLERQQKTYIVDCSEIDRHCTLGKEEVYNKRHLGRGGSQGE